MRRVEDQWGTVITVDVPDEMDRAVGDACFAWFERVDDLFSTWRPDTEIMRVGRGELAIDAASDEVREVLELCEQMRLESNGAFDIRVGGRMGVPARPGRAPLDPSGLVKGWAVQRAAEMLRSAGAQRFFVNAGGDLVAATGAEDAQAWRVGIQHPWVGDRVAAVLEIRDAAVATSGLYERGDHVLDPRTGDPALGLASVTVVGADLAIADAYATAAVVLGPDEGMRWLLARAGYEAMGVTADRAVLFTPGFERYRVS